MVLTASSTVVDPAKYLPPGMVNVVNLAVTFASRLHYRIFIVGGVVRDLLLHRPVNEIDFAVEGDAIQLANRVAVSTGARLKTHGRFGTAKLDLGDFTVDLATCRREYYHRPGALPDVSRGSIEEDLYRRDFTINALAISINRGSIGKIYDPYGGLEDLNRRYIRIIHPRSFIDDATRLWRAVRYQQRLGFRFEPATLRRMRQDAGMLDTISSDRLRHEIEHVLSEQKPELVLRRAWRIGLLGKVQQSLVIDPWIAGCYRRARRTLPSAGLPLAYLAFLSCRLKKESVEAVVTRLRLPERQSKIIRESAAVYRYLGRLGARGLKPSRIYATLSAYSPVSLRIIALAAPPSTRRVICHYLEHLRLVKPFLTGNDLRRLGVASGPEIGKALDDLLAAKLDGEVIDRAGELAFIRCRLRGKQR
jgi:tRNA nucleotidyltransferase (CCA-adding enzyme)